MKHTYSIDPLVKALKALIVPDTWEIVLSILIASILYGVSSFNYWLDVLFHNDQKLKEYSYELFSDTFTKISQLPNTANVVTAILWGVGGIAFYTVAVMVFYFFTTAQNNSTYNRPLQGKVNLLVVSLIDEYRRLVWIVLLIALASFTLFAFMPIWFGWLSEFNQTHDIKYIVGGLLCLSYNLYLLYSTTVITYRNPKIIQAA